jgi:flagellar assembly protein FliH
MSESPAASSTPGAQTWVLPQVHGPLVTPRGRSATASGLETPEAEARRRGYQQGYGEGLAAAAGELEAGRAALAARADTLRHVLDALAAPLARCDEATVRELVRLAIDVGSQLARRELRRDPSQVVAIIRECIGLLPAGARHVRVSLHPLDAAAVRECLAPVSSESAWAIVEDPVQDRGGARVQADSSRIDAGFDARVRAVVQSVLGDEREQERP